MLAEFIEHPGQSRQVVAARQAALVLLQLWLRPVEIIDRDADHATADLTAEPAFAAPRRGTETQQLGAFVSPMPAPLLQWLQCIDPHPIARHGWA